jgi:hypothetical protein
LRPAGGELAIKSNLQVASDLKGKRAFSAYWQRSLFIALTSDLAMLTAPSLFLICDPLDRLVCKCARPTLRRFSLPVPVVVIRFEAALCVFILLPIEKILARVQFYMLDKGRATQDR